MTHPRLSIGVAGLLGPDAIARIAPTVEAAGFHALWVNDTPGGDALIALAAAARVTSRLTLATGVLAVDRRPAESIAAAVGDIPQDRLVLGIGSGQTSVGALARVRDAAELLREQTDAQVLVGALGPKMRAVAATAGQGPLLSWLTPSIAAAQSAEAHALEPAAHVALYVRTALDAAARPALDVEVARYASYPKYAANFARLAISAADTVLDPDTADTRIPQYVDAVDEVVLRAIVASDAVEDYAAFVDRAAGMVD
ncbi:LLM class flavin-dependent oxidoreductase [Microbacterium sp. ASV49]|uniref:LLM class flavin-dependent oxidoreductase n=1 Tax=Microbacterium candidum TaxID=3041922 RepID=A0ABT7N1T4_9MICO|nr:LLM class flavin-dependent oxidoreductase [Microbacterium sp. ASV49]MDL9980638.1 LLM class flavin-dependent oxidoreductase [Microbacterium sp. ASV49]